MFAGFELLRYSPRQIEKALAEVRQKEMDRQRNTPLAELIAERLEGKRQMAALKQWRRRYDKRRAEQERA